MARRRVDDLYKGIEVLESAIKLEPAYAQAMATLAKAHAVLPWFTTEVSAGESREKARLLTERALELEPQNPEIWIEYSNIYAELEEYDKAITIIKKGSSQWHKEDVEKYRNM